MSAVTPTTAACNLQRALSIAGCVDWRSGSTQSAGDLVVYNPLGWERTDVAQDPLTGSEVVAADVPAFGYRTLRTHCRCPFSAANSA